jgi:hypothetical protein
MLSILLLQMYQLCLAFEPLHNCQAVSSAQIWEAWISHRNSTFPIS